MTLKLELKDLPLRSRQPSTSEIDQFGGALPEKQFVSQLKTVKVVNTVVLQMRMYMYVDGALQ